MREGELVWKLEGSEGKDEEGKRGERKSGKMWRKQTRCW